jgi:hypothetical protein
MKNFYHISIKHIYCYIRIKMTFSKIDLYKFRPASCTPHQMFNVADNKSVSSHYLSRTQLTFTEHWYSKCVDMKHTNALWGLFLDFEPQSAFEPKLRCEIYRTLVSDPKVRLTRKCGVTWSRHSI